MPIYEYECPKCGACFERLIRSLAADAPAKCPKCGAAKPVKVLSAFSVGSAGHEESSACSSCPTGTCPYAGGAGGECD